MNNVKKMSKYSKLKFLIIKQSFKIKKRTTTIVKETTIFTKKNPTTILTLKTNTLQNNQTC